jgi:chromosome segregation ATPase
MELEKNMHFMPNTTRHTSIGTFRKGTIYKVDPKDQRVKKSVVPHLVTKDNPKGVFTEMTEKQVKEHNKGVTSVAPAGKPVIKTLKQATNAMLEAQSNAAKLTTEREEALGDLETARDQLGVAATEIEGQKAALSAAQLSASQALKDVETAQSNAAKLATEREEALEQLETVSDQLGAATTEIEDLKAALAAAQSGGTQS